VKPQTAATQVAPPCAGMAQPLPHPLQLAGSEVVSVQALPQTVKPAKQAKPHAPEEHDGCAWAGAGQALPHPLQSSAVEARLTHAPLQLVRPLGHAVMHASALQTWPGPQTDVQPPQWSGSFVVWTHRSPQELKPGAHTVLHCPL
jgi:hypothetical protein